MALRQFRVERCYAADVTHQNLRIGFDDVQKMQQPFGAAAFESEMNIRDEDRSQAHRRVGASLLHSSSSKSPPTLPKIANRCYERMTRGRRFVYKKGT
jgi:hypothetical protein